MAVFNRKPKPTKLMRLNELDPMLESGKPVLLDFFQLGCAPCQVMDGIMNELAREFGDSAHIVKVDVTKVPGAAQTFSVRSTPTFVLLGRAPDKKAKKPRRGATAQPGGPRPVGQRWRTTGLVKKDQLVRLLESNGAQRTG
jgi:thioredoxin 1